MPQKDVTRAQQTSSRAVSNNAFANGVSMPAAPPLQRMENNNTQIDPDQERHLPNEAWHVVQKKKEMMRLTKQMKGPEHQSERAVQRIENVQNAEKEKRSFGPEEIEAAIRQALSKVKLDPAELVQVVKVMEQTEKVSLDISKIDQKLSAISDKAPVQRADVLGAGGPAPAGGMPILHILSALGITTGLGLSAIVVSFIYTVYQILHGEYSGALTGAAAMAFTIWLMDKL